MGSTGSSLPPSTGIEALDASWKAIAIGFLVEKAGRTGSARTTDAYARTVDRFLVGIPDPAAATPLDVHRFAYSPRPDGGPPSPSTVMVRLAAVAGFYDFARRMEMVARNPAADVRRPRARQAPPRGLTLPQVARLLAVIPETPTGLLDRAIIITALLTGLRRTELLGLTVIDPVIGGVPRYEVRTKGGTLRRRELPSPAWQAILVANTARRSTGFHGARAFGISDATFYVHLRRYGEAAGLGHVSPHALRHSAAKLRRQAGASIEEVSALLGHRSIATTAVYLRQMEDERDDGWASVARALGIPVVQTDSGMRGNGSMTGSPSRPRPSQARQGGRANSRPVRLDRRRVCTPTRRRSYRRR